MSFLAQYGWNQAFQDSTKKLLKKYPHAVPARVLSVHRTRYELISEAGILFAEISGNRLKDKDIYSKPFVGDWVLVRLGRGDDANLIEEIVPRQSILERKRTHKEDIQVIASNIDTAVLVQSVDQDFSPARLERMLVQVQESGIKPLVVINKVDMSYDHNAITQALQTLDSTIPILFVSLKTGVGISEFHSLLHPQDTVVFIGSSGVGKSSLINTLLDDHNQQKTGAISEYSGKGMHTTTVRTLLRTPTGILIIDTPGVREFGITLEDEESIQEVFSMIESFAVYCKFRNCTHTNEPACAVQKAILDNELTLETLKNYQKLKNEIQKK